MNCQSLVSANGCRTPKQCHDMASPAHYFVINSFVSLSNVSRRTNNALKRLN